MAHIVCRAEEAAGGEVEADGTAVPGEIGRRADVPAMDSMGGRLRHNVGHWSVGVTVSLQHRYQGYISHAMRRAQASVSDGRHVVTIPALGLSASGDSSDDAEVQLLAKVTVFVVAAQQYGLTLPEIDGIDLNEPAETEAEQGWTAEWTVGIEEAIAQHEAGKGVVSATGDDFLRDLDPHPAAHAGT